MIPVTWRAAAAPRARRARARIRWDIARLMDGLPGQCWSDLAMWALRERGEPGSRWPWRPAAAMCRYPAALSCYCGKFAASGTQPASSACCIRCERLNPGDPCRGCYCHEDGLAAGTPEVTR